MMINKTKLLRDYENNPLKYLKYRNNGPIKYKLEEPYKEDIEYLYNEINLTFKELKEFLNISDSSLKRILKKFQIKKNDKISKNNRKVGYDKKVRPNIIEIKNKIKQTNLEKYGVEYVFQIKQFQQKLKDIKIKKYGSVNNINKIKQTMKEKYGVEYIFQRQDIIQKTHNKEAMKKQYETKKKNNSFNTSKPEEEIYKLLCQKYENVKRQYKSEKYPFYCDFYIPSEDLYIEYNGHWTHGQEPYDENNLLHQEKLKLWESKNSKFYNNAIITWTKRDVLKRKIAKENGLNWVEFFNIDNVNK